MKKIMSVLLAAVLLLTLTGVAVFADDPNPAETTGTVETAEDPENTANTGDVQPPAFVGGAELLAVSPPQTVAVGDVLAFELAAGNFANLPADGFNNAEFAITQIKQDLKITAEPEAVGGGYFGAASFKASADGATLLAELPVTAAVPAAEYKFYVQNAAGSVATAACVLTISTPETNTAVSPSGESTDTNNDTAGGTVAADPPADTFTDADAGADANTNTSTENTGAAPEDTYTPPESTDTFIIDFATGGSAPVFQSGNPDEMVPGSALYYTVNDDNFVWHVEGDKKYDIVALNSYLKDIVIVPDRFIATFEQVGENLCLRLEAIALGEVVDEPLGLVDNEAALVNANIIDPYSVETSAENIGAVDLNTAEDFSTGTGMMLMAAKVVVNPADGDITGIVNNANVISYEGTYPSAPVDKSTVISLALDADNCFTQDGTAVSIDKIKDTLSNKAGWIKSSNPGLFSAVAFNVDTTNKYVYVSLTLGKTVPVGTTVYLEEGSNKTQAYTFATEIKVKETDSSKVTVVSATSTVSQWKHVSGLPSTSSATPVTSAIKFTVPEDNFTTFSAGLYISEEQLNSTAITSRVEVLDGGVDVTSKFTGVKFAREADGTISVTLTPDPNKFFMLSSGATFGFKDVSTSRSAATTFDIYMGKASSSGTIVGIADDAVLGGKYSRLYLNGKLVTDINWDEMIPGDEVMFKFDPWFFTWKDDQVPSKVTASIAKNITVGTTNATKDIDKVLKKPAAALSTDGGEAAVKIEFVKPFVSTKEVEFGLTLYLLQSKKRHTASELEIDGVMCPESEEFDSSYNDSEIDLSDGIIGDIIEAIRKVRIYLGNGVYVNVASLRKNTSIYGVATVNEDLSESDESIMDKYPDIEYVYELYTIGLNGAGNTVDFEDLGTKYYVYVPSSSSAAANTTTGASTSTLTYVGTTSDKAKLPYATKYYLSTKELTLAAASTPTPTDDPGEPVDDIPLPSNTSPTNGYDNPATGR